MNLHTDKQLDSAIKIDCIIIPMLPSDNDDSETLKSKYNITGLHQHLDKVSASNGAFSSCFFGDTKEANFTLILLNAKADSAAELNQQMVDFATKNKLFLNGHIAIDLDFYQSEPLDMLPSLLRSIFLSNYNIGQYKTENTIDTKNITDLSILAENHSALDFSTIVERAQATAQTMQSIMSLVDAPANIKTPLHLANWITSSAATHNYTVKVIEKEQLEELGFHALLAVNRGSEDPAKCLVAQYEGKSKNDKKPTIALVGKGVTFDTGGLSIKPSQNMHYMKSDMGGAAAVLGTMELVAKLGLDINLVAVVPCTDNSVDNLAIKPGDVIQSYKGSTIEVIDTDAEGRLILADGLAYAIKEFNPDYLVDLATLTGSIVRTLGSHAAGLMTKSEFMSSTLIEAGTTSGDRLWPLPLWDEYAKYMASDVADIRNLSTKPVAGAITAGKFLEHFTDEHPNWAHLDIAGTAFGTSPFAKGYSASGFGILLLLSWIELIIQKSNQ